MAEVYPSPFIGLRYLDSKNGASVAHPNRPGGCADQPWEFAQILSLLVDWRGGCIILWRRISKSKRKSGR